MHVYDETWCFKNRILINSVHTKCGFSERTRKWGAYQRDKRLEISGNVSWLSLNLQFSKWFQIRYKLY